MKLTLVVELTGFFEAEVEIQDDEPIEALVDLAKSQIPHYIDGYDYMCIKAVNDEWGASVEGLERHLEHIHITL